MFSYVYNPSCKGILSPVYLETRMYLQYQTPYGTRVIDWLIKQIYFQYKVNEVICKETIPDFEENFWK